MRIHRGSLVYDKADPRHVGIVRNIAWRVYGREGLVDVEWLETGWRSICAFRDLRISTRVPSTAEERRARFEFPRRGR